MAEKYIPPREFLRQVKEKRPDLDDEYILRSWDEHVKPLAGQADKEGEGTSLFGMSDEQRDHVARGGYLTDRVDEMREFNEGWGGDRRSDLKAGAGQGAETIGTLLARPLGGMDNALRAKGQEMQEEAEGERSAQYQADIEARDRDVEAADGELAKGAAWLRHTFSDKDLLAGLLAEEGPTTVAGGLAGLGAKALTKGAAKRLGKSDEAANKAGNYAGTGTAVGVGMAESGAMTKSQTYDSLVDLGPEEFMQAAEPAVKSQYEALLAEGATEEQAVKTIADDLSTTAGVTAGMFTGLMNALPASRGLERVITGSWQKNRGGMGGAIKQGAKVGTAEGATQAGDEAFQQGAENYQLGKVDEDQSLTEGAGVAAAQGFAFGGPTGTAAGVIEGAAGPGEEPRANDGTPGDGEPETNINKRAGDLAGQWARENGRSVDEIPDEIWQAAREQARREVSPEDKGAGDPDEYVVDRADGQVKKRQEAAASEQPINPDRSVFVEGLGEREFISALADDQAMVRGPDGKRDVVQVIPGENGPRFAAITSDDTPAPETQAKEQAVEQINQVRQSGPLGRAAAPSLASALNQPQGMAYGDQGAPIDLGDATRANDKVNSNPMTPAGAGTPDVTPAAVLAQDDAGPSGTMPEPDDQINAQIRALRDGAREEPVFFDGTTDQLTGEARQAAEVGLAVESVDGGTWIARDVTQRDRILEAEETGLSPEEVRAAILGYQKPKGDIDLDSAQAVQATDADGNIVRSELADAESLAGALNEAEQTANAAGGETNVAAPEEEVAGRLDTDALQNRDRSRAALQAQVRDIATNPDYDRVSISRTPDSGAPMAFPRDGYNVADSDMGREDTVTMADGRGGSRRVPVRYAVVEAAELQPSHDASGNRNDEYGARGLTALNNGRAAGLKSAWEQGTASNYREAMLLDEEAHGIPRAAIESKENPVMVRLFDENAIADLESPGAASNMAAGAELSATEQAITDARTMSDATIGNYRGGDVNTAANRDFVRSAINDFGGPASAAGMMQGDGTLSADGARRLRLALLAKAYDNPGLIAELAESADTEIKGIGESLIDAAGQWAQMRAEAEAGNIDPAMDVTDALTEAVDVVMRARKEGKSIKGLADQRDLLSGDAINPVAETFLRLFFRDEAFKRPRAKAKVTDGLVGYTENARATMPGEDMFGDRADPQQTLETQRDRIEQQEGQPGAQSGLFTESGQPATGSDRPGGQERARDESSGREASGRDPRANDEAPQARDAQVGIPEGAQTKSDGTPFATERAAKTARTNRGLAKTHDLQAVDGGFVLVPQGAQPQPEATDTAETTEATGQPDAATQAEPDADRRADENANIRALAADADPAAMTPEQMRQAIEQLRAQVYTDPMTGLGNGAALVRAWANSPRDVQVSIDADSLKWINDNFDHASGDKMLALIGEALAGEGVEAYHKSGDEFWMQADSEADAEQAMQRIADRLAGATIVFEHDDGSITAKTGIGLSYGIASGATNDLKQAERRAERRLQEHKQQRERDGLRAGREQDPPGVERTPARSDAGVPGDTAEGNADQVGNPAAAQGVTDGFTPTHESATGEPLRELDDEPGVYENAAGEIIEDDYATPISAADGQSAESDQQARNMRGAPIDDEWSSFSDESGTRGIPRSEMPQVKSEHRGALANFLSARGIESVEETVPALSLKPTQREFSEARIDAAKDREGGDRAILVSSDDHVVDGHHQWMADADQGSDVRVIRLDAPIDDVLEAAREFPSSEVDDDGGANDRADQDAPVDDNEQQATDVADNETADGDTQITPDQFGDALPPARRDQRSSIGEMTDDEIGKQPLSKLWPLSEIEEMPTKWGRAFATAARSNIRRKPRDAWKKRAWVNEVKMMRGIFEAIRDGRITRDRIEEVADEPEYRRLKRTMFAKVKLLEQIDESEWSRIGHVEEFPDAHQIKGPPGNTYTVQSPQVAVRVDDRRKSFEGSGQAEEIAPQVAEYLAQSEPEQESSADERRKYEIRRNTRTGEVTINRTGDKQMRTLRQFDTVDEAREFLRSNTDALAEAWEAIKARDNVRKTDLRRKDNRDRIGKDHRNGRDITVEQFQDTFGFRGGEFGKWVQQGKNAKERQGILNAAYDGLMDMADVLGVPPRAISLGGRLGIAFGARGRGWASAHFEPDTFVINLTKTRGAGSLAHEWFHALDNHFQLKRGEPASNKTEDNFITYGPENYYRHKDRPSIRIPERHFDDAMAGKSYMGGRKILPAGRDRSQWEYVGGIRPEVGAAFAELTEALDKSPMTKRTEAIDGSRSKKYWSQIIERAARGFESYMIEKMRQESGRNEFLANVVSVEEFTRDPERYPYLLPDELEPITQAFDTLFSVIETEEGADGNVVMFSRASQTGAAFGMHEQVERAVRGITKGWANAPDAIVVESMSDPRVPSDVQAENERQLSQGAEGQPQGFYYQGRVYVVSGALGSVQDAERVLFHEALGHYGLRGVFGDALDGELDRLAKARPADIRAKAKEYGLVTNLRDARMQVAEEGDADGRTYSLDELNRLARERMQSDRRIAAEEVLAELAQDKPEIGFVRRAIAAIRQWLRENVPMFRDMGVTDAEIVRDYIEPARAFVEQTRYARSAGRQSEVRDPANQYALDLDPAPSEPAQKAQLADNFRIKRKRVPIGKVQSAFDTVSSAEQAAHVMAPIRKHGVENFYALVTDGDGKILDLQRHGKGDMSSAPADPGVIASSVASVPGAKQVWFGHNHPSGRMIASRADLRITGTLNTALDGSGIETAGHVVFGEGRSATFIDALGDGSDTIAITPARRDRTISITESQVRRRRMSGAPEIKAPADAKAFVEDMDADSGILLLANTHQVIGSLALSNEEMSRLRDGDTIPRILKALHDSGAAATIIKASSEEVANNVARYLVEKGKARVLDGFVSGQGGGIRSMAEIGEIVTSSDGRAWYSRSQGGDSLPDAIEVDGKRRPARNSNGQPIAADEQGVRNFWRWFGDSRVVDEQGRPMVAFHGSPDARGLFDQDGKFQTMWQRYGEDDPEAAFFFTDRRDVARTYADDSRAFDYQNAENAIGQLYLSIKNPMEVDAGGRSWGARGGPAAQGEQLEQAKRDGHDGLVIRNTVDTYNVTATRPHSVFVAFEPEQIKSAEDGPVRSLFNGQPMDGSGPNSGAFDGSDPRIHFSRGPTASERPPRNGGFTRLKSSSDKALDSFIYNIVDRFKDLADFQKAAGSVPETADAMMAQENFAGRARKRLDDLDDFHVKPILEVMNRGGFDMEEVGRFLHARHAKEANAVLAERNPDREDNQALSGMSNQEADAILTEYADNADMQEVGRSVDEMNRTRLEKMVDDGLLSPEQAESWASMYQHYVPLHRDMLTDEDGDLADVPNMPAKGQGFHIAGKESKVRAGSTKPVEHGLIFTHMVAQYEASATRGEKNLVGQALLELVTEHPDPNLWEIDKPRKVAALNAAGEVVYRPDPMLRDNELSVKVGGKSVRVTFNDKNPQAMRLVSEMRNLTQKQMPKLMQFMHGIMRVLSMVNTSLNPEFTITNYARDLQTAFYNLGDTELHDMATRIVKDASKHGIKAMWRSRRGTVETEWDRWADEFERAGGMVGWMDIYENVEDRANAINRELAMIGPGHRSKKALRAASDLIMDANNAIENAVRLSAFVHGRRNGMSSAKAANLAKNLTVNFNRRGAQGQLMNTMYLFFNASVQGTARMFSALGKSRKVQAMAGATVVAAAVLDMVNRALSDEDDDGLTWYDKLPNHVKDRNIVIVYGGGKDDYVTIPAPWGYNVFHVVGQTIGRGVSNAIDPIPTYSIAGEAGRLATATMDAFNPISSASPLLTLSPTLLDPGVSIATNTAWHGGPLMPDQNPFSERPDSERYFATASAPSKWITQTLNELTGGNELRSGAFDVSPESLDLLVSTMTGGAGHFVLNTIDTGYRAAAPGEEIEKRNAPFYRKLFGSEYDTMDYEMYYDRKSSLETLKRELDTFTGEEYQEVATRFADERKMLGRLKTTEKRLKALRKRKDLLKARDASKDRVEAIDDEIVAEIKRFNTLYNRVVLK